MIDIRKIHENVLQFLLHWRESMDTSLFFTLRKRPLERLQSGQWFLGNENYLAFSFWTGKDWVNKTQNIYVEIDNSGFFRLRFSAKDDRDKAALLEFAASVLGGFSKVKKHGYAGNVWTKDYPGNDYLKNLETFLTEDKNRIDALLQNQKNSGYNPAFERAFNKLDPVIFQESLAVIQNYRLQRHFPLPTSVPPINKELKLKEMTVVNTGLFANCTIQFGERATCLIGENGGGKTTLLRAAALGLVGTGSPLMDTKAFELQNLLKISGTDGEYRIHYAGKGFVRVSYQYNHKLFENGKANFIPFNPRIDAGEVEFNEDHIDEEGFGLPIGENGMYEDGELPILVIGFPQRYGKKDDGTDVKKRSPKPNAYDILPLILNTEDNRIESLKLWISEAWNQGDAHRQKVKDLFSIISKVLSEENEPFNIEILSAISQRKIVVATPFNPDGIPFDLLSTGLSNLFGWVGHLISRMHEAYPNSDNPLNEPAVVLVDEIDNYLHPIVQVRTAPILLDAFPNVQFVFTSHSPMVLAALPNEKVIAYRVEKGEASKIDHFYGRTVQDILRDEYGVNKRPAIDIQKQIDQMTRHIALEDKDEAQQIYNKLSEILGNNDPAILDAKHDLN